MSVKIEGTTIEMTRGDTLATDVEITVDDAPYAPQQGDSIHFYVKRAKFKDTKQYFDSRPVISKEIPTNTMVLKLDPNDTKGLDFGMYHYNCQITFSNGDVYTFIPEDPDKPAILKICPEVY